MMQTSSNFLLAIRQETSRNFLPRFLTFGLLLLLAACAQTVPSGPGVPLMQEVAEYQAHARSYYEQPGPPEDPWGPYIREASERFDVPDVWIRAVMKQESGGHLYDSNGGLITSAPGAMGLMQVMPPAYDDLRQQYNLGPDPYDPHDNIMAGTAYIRQMYDIYGTPGFLAAYNDGPGNVDHYLRQNRPLPRETRRYVASIGPQIMGIWPQNRSRADLMVSRYDQTAQRYSSTDTDALNNTSLDDGATAATQVAQADAISEPPPSPPLSGSQSVSAAWAARGFAPTPAPSRPRPALHRPAVPTEENGEGEDELVRVRSIPLAHPTYSRRGQVTDMVSSDQPGWEVQIGSYASRQQASVVAEKLQHFVTHSGGRASTSITPVTVKGHTLYRTRYTGLTKAQASRSCQKLSSITPCFTVSP
ncbi:lytic transglycosylase domain-containing protein [Acetobacteraceae bacterium ESL0709]|nr:lytic transglycosylase domain-containing protein [Acetobacteraceae bacterium ESL0697]MDF7678486.1 lytic transglycosylase domain-containing protein [Acetobacteraceae bacterium ESL0709]